MCLLVNRAETAELKETTVLLERYKVVRLCDDGWLKSIYFDYTWTVGKHETNLEYDSILHVGQYFRVVDKAFHVFKTFADAQELVSGSYYIYQTMLPTTVLKVNCDVKDLVASGLDMSYKPSEAYTKVTVTAEGLLEAINSSRNWNHK